MAPQLEKMCTPEPFEMASGNPISTRASPLGGLAEDVVRDVLDVVGAEALAEGRHGALA
eukprot:CAMPEP_0113827332 /NCGR_PEP_ID=MMETSP0328-20130328/4712_1 /TAXON_ID=39455 /ORGANISM="Alexandrium minutum" /LENGTH=58 /DNA_ID=CAMNT_0000795317 /DNA_START=67 /DNA_END=240 /DNA_ORIENTATION=- /assembly_acc=CAM_ASM_000350